MARAGAAFVAERAQAVVAAGGSFHFAVGGGHTLWAMFAELASQAVAWDKVVIYQVDERVARPDDPDRNPVHLTNAPGSAPAQLRAMPVNEDDLAAAGRRAYPAALPGLSIAMADASHEVQRAARRVTTTNQDRGFANAVEQFILTLTLTPPAATTTTRKCHDCTSEYGRRGCPGDLRHHRRPG